MATTTNYGWSTPDDTALVKDGAAAIRTLGSSVDTTTKALNPSTTLGDIEYRSSSANTNTRLAIGSTGDVLTVAGGVPTWAAAAGGGSLVNISTVTLTGTSNQTQINNCFSSTYANYLFLINLKDDNAQESSIFARLTASGSETSTGYYQAGLWIDSTATTITGFRTSNLSQINMRSCYSAGNFYNLQVGNPFATTQTSYSLNATAYSTSISDTTINNGMLQNSTSYDGIKFVASSGSSLSGTIRIYAYKNS